LRIPFGRGTPVPDTVSLTSGFCPEWSAGR
jgi:hypothetical protein